MSEDYSNCDESTLSHMHDNVVKATRNNLHAFMAGEISEEEYSSRVRELGEESKAIFGAMCAIWATEEVA